MKTKRTPPCPGAPGDDFATIGEALSSDLQPAGRSGPLPIFFRADDIGVVSSNFLRLLQLFQNYAAPLCLAVVPAWLTTARLSAISAHIDTGSPQWCWHMHGWTHGNHQRSGKKCEFGSDRSAAAIEKDIVRGRDRLESILGSAFYPVFTPPWNRCTATTAAILKKHGFKAVSRSFGEQKNHLCLPDYCINVDLHTRKEADPLSARDGLRGEWRQAVNQGRIGVMIHHQLMSEDDFNRLEWLLKTASLSPMLHACSFADLYSS